MSEEKVKITIIGAGPGGVAAGVEAKVANIEPVTILEKAKTPFNTIETFYHKGKRVDPVYRKVKVDPIGTLFFDTETKEQFLERMHNIINEYKLDIRTQNEVQKVISESNVFKVITSTGLTLISPIVIVAIGVFGKPVKPHYPIPKEVKDRVHFRVSKSPPTGEKILVVGGGDSAAEVACFLADRENDVTLSYRRDKFFRMNDVNLKAVYDRVDANKLKLKMPSDIIELRPHEDGVEVVFKDNGLEVFDSIYYCLGGITPQGFLEDIGVELDGKKPKVDKYGETNIERLFLVGDIKEGKGSIMAAFNSAKIAIDRIKEKYKELVYEN